SSSPRNAKHWECRVRIADHWVRSKNGSRCGPYERLKMAAAKKRVIVVGGGLAGLAATIKLAEEGMNVDLFSMVPVKRSHSVCAQGGINACNDIARQQGYSEWVHFDETVLGGDFLADQPPVLEMCNWA